MTFTCLLLLTILTNKIILTTYRIIIIDNGYHNTPSSNPDPQTDWKKLYTAVLFKNNEEYKKPEIQKIQNNQENEENEIIDILDNWELVCKIDYISNLETKMEFFGGWGNKELPISNINIEFDKFSTVNNFNVKRGEFFENDENSLFSFFELGETETIYENKGFSLIIVNSEFSFRNNIFFMEDFISEIDENKISLEFTAITNKYFVIKDESTKKHTDMKFVIKLKEIQENEKLDQIINPELQKLNLPKINFTKKIKYYTKEENINKFTTTILQQNLENVTKNFKMEFQYQKEINKNTSNSSEESEENITSFIITKNNILIEENNSKIININVYCELIVDGLKRFYKTINFVFDFNKGNYGDEIGDRCFNDFLKEFDFGSENPFLRKFDFVNVKVFSGEILENFKKERWFVNSLVVSVYAESDRTEGRMVLI